MAKQRWSDLSPSTRRLVVAASIVELALTTVALTDLTRRPSVRVRGPKWLWALATLVQPIGPVAYLTVGRRPG